MTRRLITAAMCVLASGAAIARQPGQGMPAQWPAGLVRVDVMADDARGDPALGLTRDDFEILIDGEPRPVAYFSADAAPLTLAILVDVTASLHPGVSTIAGSPSSVFIGMGTTIKSSLTSLHAPDEIPPAVTEFALHGVQPGDRVRAGAIGRTLILSDRYTGDSREIARDWHAIFKLPPVEWLGPSPLWDAIADVTTTLAAESGRRAIVVVSDGQAGGNVLSSRDVARLAALAGISVSVVAEEAVMADEPLTPMSAFGIDPAKALRAIAAATGGAFVLDRASEDTQRSSVVKYFKRDPAKALRAVLDRLHRSYTLGFASASADGKPHTLQVRVKRPGVTVAVRTQYN